MKIVTQAKINIRNRRENAEAQSMKIQKELSKFPDYEQKDDEIRAQILKVAAAYETENEQKERKILAKLRKEQGEIIAAHGYKPNSITPQYGCKLCSDSGIVKGKHCKCLKDEIRRLLFEQCQIFNPEFTFANNKSKSKAFSLMKDWCDKFPNSNFKNIVMVGASGVGKTYLCSCIANSLIERETDVLFVTAYNLNQKFLQTHVADVADKQELIDAYESVQVLIIDDLGTEPMLKNVTEEYFFALINERLSRGLNTIVSTNLSMSGIITRYSERFFSRLTDIRTCLAMELVGEDKRH